MGSTASTDVRDTTVLVNGSPMQIRENLHALLSVLDGRSADCLSDDPARETGLLSHHFWADAICINQEDLHERGLQVNLMGPILLNGRGRHRLAWS